jgi:hypothetical protein
MPIDSSYCSESNDVIFLVKKLEVIKSINVLFKKHFQFCTNLKLTRLNFFIEFAINTCVIKCA